MEKIFVTEDELKIIKDATLLKESADQTLDQTLRVALTTHSFNLTRAKEQELQFWKDMSEKYDLPVDGGEKYTINLHTGELICKPPQVDTKNAGESSAG